MSLSKITFLIWRDQPGGIEVLLPLIANKLKNLSFSAFVFRNQTSDSKSVFANTKVKTRYGRNNSVLLYPKLYYYLRKINDEVIHGFNLGPFILFVIRIARVKKTIYSIHGTIYWRTGIQRIVRKIFWQLAINKKVFFIANSEYSKQVFLSKVSGKPQIKVLYNPFDCNRFNIKDRTYNNKNALKVCYCGRLSKSKNLIKWIDAAEHILKSFPNFEFNIFGDGALRSTLDEYIGRKNLKHKIILRGFRKDIENVYKENDLLLFLSEYESFGNVAVESILCGTPVIVSKIPSMEEIFRNYSEFLVGLDENLNDCILKKIKDYENLKTLAVKANNEFKERFSLEKHISELKKIYKKFE